MTETIRTVVTAIMDEELDDEHRDKILEKSESDELIEAIEEVGVYDGMREEAAAMFPEGTDVALRIVHITEEE